MEDFIDIIKNKPVISLGRFEEQGVPLSELQHGLHC